MPEAVLTRSTVVLTLRRELRRLLDEVDAHPLMRALLEGTATRGEYVSFLAQTRHYVERTYPILAAAGRRMYHLNVHRKLADLYMQKAEEEEGHDILIDNDLRALGLDPEVTLAAGAGPSLSSYNAWIEAVSWGYHPSCFFGSAYILEAFAVERAGGIADAMRGSCQIDEIKAALSFLKLHAEADVEHVDDLEQVLDRLDDDREQEAIALTATVTRELYVGMLTDALSASAGAGA